MIADIDKDGRCVQCQQLQHTWHGQEAAECWLNRSDDAVLTHLSTAAATSP
jgi:hypothetical protein